jgi:AcrR family transcriptional regulator
MGRPPRITREQLLDTARRVFVTKGFEATTLADIAAELGVTAAAVLRHAGSKHELFLAAIRGGAVDVPEFIAALRDVDPATDPRIVLRGIAERFIPFASKTIATNLAVYMHNQASTSFVLPFDTSSESSPPKRGLRIVTEYFRRAAAAGVIRVRDPRAAALVFMGSLQSYVFLHQVLNVSAEPYPLQAWIDQLIDVWTSGAIVVDGAAESNGVAANAVGGTRGRKAKPSRQNSADRDRGHRSDRDVRLPAAKAKAARARPGRVARSADGERRVAVRRPRRPRSGR